MKVLICTTKYSLDDKSPYLTNELVNQFLLKNAEVEVLLIPWDDEFIPKNNKSFVLIKKPFFSKSKGFIGLVGKWFLSSLKFYPFLFKKILFRQKYDLVIFFSPSVIFGPALLLSKLISNKTACIYWDFFPVHNYEIGMPIPKSLLVPLKYYERYLNSLYSIVFLMSPRNIDFYKKYFSSKHEVSVLPIWRNLSTNTHTVGPRNVSAYPVKFVFGGQLILGRGIDDLMAAFSQAISLNSNIQLYVVGKGPLSKSVCEYEKSTHGKIKLIDHMHRSDYSRFLEECDVGVICTVANVSVPSYPSKALDYMAAKLPLAISVEATTDFGEIAVLNKYGLTCTAGDVDGFSKIILKLAEDSELRKDYGSNGFNYLLENHSVVQTVEKLISIL